MRSTVNQLSNQAVITTEELSKKITFNGLENCVFTVFHLENIVFNSGAGAADVASYIPENYNLVSCFVQLEKPIGVIIESAEITETTLSLKARNISNGGLYTGTPEVIRCFGICQKNDNDLEIEGDGA